MEFENMMELEVKEEPADSADQRHAVKLAMYVGVPEPQPVDMFSTLRVKQEPVEVAIEYEDSAHTGQVHWSGPDSRTDTGLSVTDDGAGCSTGIYTRVEERPSAQRTATVLEDTRGSTQHVITADCSRLESVKSSVDKPKKDKLYECAVCSKRFSTKRIISAHIMTHSSDKSFECRICGKLFTTKPYLNAHLKLHTEEKPYKCLICYKQFAIVSYLSQHLKIHTGEKSHQCAVCSKRFTRKNHLNLHMLSHTGEKPHQCTICEKRFTQKYALKTHSRLHTGERPQRCKI